jgi:hypothetical protein
MTAILLCDMIKDTKNSLIQQLKYHVLRLEAEQLGKQQLENYLCSLLQGTVSS